jgi:hypothetical protein
MALPDSRTDREYQKFEDTAGGPAVRTTATISGTVTANINGDYVDQTTLTVGSDYGLAMGALATGTTVSAGEFGFLKMNTSRELATTINNAPDITNINGTVSLPTGASTSANQATANTSLSNIDTNTEFFRDIDITINRNADGTISSVVSTDGSQTKTETIGRNADGTIATVTVAIT